MEHRNLEAARDALLAIRGMVSDALESPHARRQVTIVTRLDLAYDFRRLHHAQICHYLRCDASRDVLQIVQDAVNLILDRLNLNDPHAQTALEIIEPYRHHLYSSVIVVALVAADKTEMQRERESWRNRNAMRMPRTIDCEPHGIAGT